MKAERGEIPHQENRKLRSFADKLLKKGLTVTEATGVLSIVVGWLSGSPGYFGLGMVLLGGALVIEKVRK